tara:strand:+ start:98 stop:394 length:297 start_codon:yes stop_codon:yes gene_type:complete
VAFFASILPEFPANPNRNLEKILSDWVKIPLLLILLPHIECSQHNSLFANDSDIGKKSAGFAGFRDPNNEFHVLVAASLFSRFILDEPYMLNCFLNAA